jgi:hypothetical protein
MSSNGQREPRVGGGAATAAAFISQVRAPQAWLLGRGVPVGQVNTGDLFHAEPFRNWAGLRPAPGQRTEDEARGGGATRSLVTGDQCAQLTKAMSHRSHPFLRTGRGGRTNKYATRGKHRRHHHRILDQPNMQMWRPWSG